MADRADIAKRVERAEKFLQKGKPEAALEEYLSVLQEDRENDTVRQMAADLSISVGRGPEAVALLGELFERQVAVGDATRASLTYKKLARHSNPTTEQKIKFGQLLEGSNRKLALETYEAGLHELGAKGSKLQQMAVLKRIVALDASLPNFVRIGELAADLGDGRGAAAAFLRVAELTEQSGGAPASWYERAYQADGTNPKIALAYGRSLLVQGEAGAAIFVLTPLLNEGTPSNDLRDVYAGALLAAGRFKDAEPHVMALFEQNPSRLPQVTQLIGNMIDAQMDRDAVGLARKLEQFQRRRGERRAFLATMQDLVSRHRSSADLLEFLVELYNSSNRETDYCQTLLRLFDLYHKTGNFAKAGECLDRAAEVDPYEPGHQRRLELLKGNLDETQYSAIASRLAPTGGKKPTPETTTTAAEPSMGASALQDLMLQAEILVQYGMHAKAGERLQRIQELFPSEAEHNEELQRLYTSAGIVPPVPAKPAAAPVPPPVGVVAVTPPPAPSPVPAAHQGPDLNQLTRVAEVSRQLYRQNDPAGVLSVVAKEVGSLWKLTRCMAATRRPGQAMSAFQEYHATGSRHAEETEAATLVAVVDDLCRSGPMVWPNVNSATELQAVKVILADLNVAALLALPMSDGEEHAGVLLLMQDTARAWHENETFVVRTIAEQAGMALRNLGLRRLVSNLSVTDAKSGLLSRSSYLDVLFGEARRSQEESSSLTTVLLQFGESAALVKQFGQDAVEAMMQQIGRILAGHIRQNDFAFRYETATVALILGNTGEVNALQAVEKFRALLTGIHWPNQTQAVQFATGVAEAVIRPQFDPVDIVTEVINRVEQALDLALCDETAGVQVLGSTFAAAAAVA